MDDRPTTELQLPESGAKVILYANLRTGDVRKIRRATFASMGLKLNINDPKAKPDVNEINGSFVVDAEELTLECLLKAIVAKDGTEIANKQDFIYNLPQADGDLVYQKVNEISGGSALSPELKKK